MDGRDALRRLEPAGPGLRRPASTSWTTAANRYTYAYVDDAAARLASWLKDVGVEEGDVVSFQMPVWAEFCIVYVACLKAGAVMHPLSRAFNERDLRYVLNQVKSAAFICRRSREDAVSTPRSSPSKQTSPRLKASLYSIATGRPSPPFPSSSASWKATSRSKRSLSARQPTTPPSSSLRRGTTGNPKAVLLTHNNLLFSERAFTEELELTSDDVHVHACAAQSRQPASTTACFPPCCWEEKAVLQEKFDAERADRPHETSKVSPGPWAPRLSSTTCWEQWSARASARRSCASICAAEPPSPNDGSQGTGEGHRTM